MFSTERESRKIHGGKLTSTILPFSISSLRTMSWSPTDMQTVCTGHFLEGTIKIYVLPKVRKLRDIQTGNRELLSKHATEHWQKLEKYMRGSTILFSFHQCTFLPTVRDKIMGQINWLEKLLFSSERKVCYIMLSYKLFPASQSWQRENIPLCSLGSSCKN